MLLSLLFKLLKPSLVVVFLKNLLFFLEKFVFLDLNREDEEMDEQLKICDQLAKDYKKKETLVAMFDDSSVDKETQLKSLHKCLNKVFEEFPVEGDKVTFIGSTFLNYGEEKPYFNHCIVLGDCNNIDAENTEVQLRNFRPSSRIFTSRTIRQE